MLYDETRLGASARPRRRSPAEGSAHLTAPQTLARRRSPPTVAALLLTSKSTPGKTRPLAATSRTHGEPNAHGRRRPGAVGWGVFGGLALSLAANAFLMRASRAYFREENAVRLDPGGLDAYAHAPPPREGKPVLVFFGDSRALMWGRPRELQDYEVVNRGVGNQTTAQILLRFDADLPKLKPAVVVLEAGVNDLKTIAEFPERGAQIVAECESNLRRIVQRCREIGAGVVLVTVFEIGDLPLWRRPFWSEDVRSAVREVNTFLPSLVETRVILLDAAPVLDDTRGRIRPEYQLDYLHLSPSGYSALTEQLGPQLRAFAR